MVTSSSVAHTRNYWPSTASMHGYTRAILRIWGKRKRRMCKRYRKLGAAHTPDAHQGHHYISASPAPPYRRFSWCGDGTGTPEQLIDSLVREQFGLVAITDHDRVDTAAMLQQLAAEKQLPLLAAVEMSTSWSGELTDVLCYGFDAEKNELGELAQDIVRRQRENTRQVCENLRKIGISFPNLHELDALLAKPSAQ